VRKLLLLISLCAFAAVFAPGRASATDPCGRPEGHANWIDFGSLDFADLFGRRGTILAVSSGDFPAQMRAAGAITVYWDMYLKRRVGEPSAPADPATIVPAANRLFDYAATQSSCSTPWIAENELFGAGLATPWSDTNAQYRANVLTYLQTLAARGARPFLLVSSHPFTGGEAAAWWQQVAAVADIVRETYFSAKKLYQQGPIVGNRTVRTAMRTDLQDFLAIGIPASKLGVMLGFQTTPGSGGRERLQPASAWFDVVKWQALAAREIAKELGISSIWSWGWGTWTAVEQDPDKRAAACVWLWTRAHSLCNGPAAAGPDFDASLTEGQIVLAPGVQCRVGASSLTDGAVEALAKVTGDRELAYTALFARIVGAQAEPVTTALILAAERAVIASRFNGSSADYRAALARAGATVAIARAILSDELRRTLISETFHVPTPSAPEIATFYESYPGLLVRPVTAKPAPAWLGRRVRGLALDSIAPESVFKLPAGSTATVLTIDGSYRVRPAGDPRPLGTMPLSVVTPAIRAALTSFARGAAYGDWTIARENAALATTTCAKDELPATGSVELEDFLPFLSATG
jgi:hypothetical protein